MAWSKQAGSPLPHIPRLVALHGPVRGITNFIGGNSQTRLFYQL